MWVYEIFPQNTGRVYGSESREVLFNFAKLNVVTLSSPSRICVYAVQVNFLFWLIESTVDSIAWNKNASTLYVRNYICF